MLKVLGLGSFRDSAQSSINKVEEPVGQTVSISRFSTERSPFEVLGRSTIGKLEGSLRPEFGAEVAYNRLGSRIALEVEDAGGVRPIALPASDVTVEELRGEAFGNLTWVAAPKWTLEAGLAIETSRITVTGDADGENSFTFVKPSIAATHQVSDAIQERRPARFQRFRGLGKRGRRPLPGRQPQPRPGPDHAGEPDLRISWLDRRGAQSGGVLRMARKCA